MSNPKKLGRPSQQLDAVIYVRASKRLKKLLEKATKAERVARPGANISISDVAREILYKGLEEYR